MEKRGARRSLTNVFYSLSALLSLQNPLLPPQHATLGAGRQGSTLTSPPPHHFHLGNLSQPYTECQSHGRDSHSPTRTHGGLLRPPGTLSPQRVQLSHPTASLQLSSRPTWFSAETMVYLVFGVFAWTKGQPTFSLKGSLVNSLG